MISKEWEPKLVTLLKEGISKPQLKKDILSGIIVGVIALPLAIAFAIASGVSPETGMMTAIIGGLIVSLFGGSRVQIGGPTGAFIVLIVSIISQHGMEGLLLSTFLAGIMLILMGLFRMGSLLKYIPQTLITGFTGAIALIIFLTQVNDFLGLAAHELPDEFLHKLIYYITHLSKTNPWSVFTGTLTILIILILPKLSKKIPSVFAALILVTLATVLLKIPVETIGDRFGEISFHIPQFSFFNLNIETILLLLPAAFSLALLAALESLLSAVVADSMIGGHHRSNVELMAMGLANSVISCFGGIPVTGAIARTASNINSGGRTPVAGIVHALTLLLIYLVAMPVVKMVPMACLAAILIMVAWRMSEAHVFINTLKINRYESAVMLTTFFLTLLTDLTIAIPAGFILAVLLFMKRMADSVEYSPLLFSKVNDQIIFSQELGEYDRRIRIVELNGPMFFGSVFHLMNIQEKLNRDFCILILRFRYVPIVDSSGLTKLELLLHDMQHHDIQVLFTGLNETLTDKFLRMGLVDESCMFKDVEDALHKSDEILKQN